MPASAYLHDASPEILEQAVAENHRERFILEARALGGEVHEAPGVTWTYGSAAGASMILFPRLSDAHAGSLLDAVVAYYVERRPEKLVGCWSLAPPQPADLEVRLLARGFQLGWQPCWMWLDLHRLADERWGPDGLRVEPFEAESDARATDIPYDGSEMTAARRAAMRLAPEQLRHFGAWLDGRLVARSTLFLTTGPLGVAGLYDVGVSPDVRNRGIGKAVTAEACRQARELGYRYALLNATGERMYRQLGFERLGYGLTWWLNVPRLAARSPSQNRIALAEAMGRGDLAALDALAGRCASEELNETLPNGMSLVQLALHTGKRPTAEWLIDHGASLDLVTAWDLGGRERAGRLLATRPAAVNEPLGENQLTPLHVAVERGDVELARLVLSAQPDLAIEDSLYRGTPLGWAQHLGRTEIARLIEEYAGARDGA